MDNENLKTGVVFNLFVLGGFVLFGVLGFILGKPYRTDAALVFAGVVIVYTIIMAICEFLGSWSLAVANLIAYGFYIAGAVAVLNMFVFTAWGQIPYWPTISVWTIALAGVLVTSQLLRTKARAEIEAAEAGVPVKA